MWFKFGPWGARADALGDIRDQLSAINKQGNLIMATLDDIVAAVAAEKTEIESLKTFIAGLRAEIVAVPALTADQQAKIDAIFADVTADTAAIAAAISTPASPAV